MQKLLILFILCTVNSKGYAQIKYPLIIKNIDSVKNLEDSTENLLDDEKITSHVIFSTSIGNTLFANRNSSIKSKTFVNNTAVYSPSVSYINKSGLSLSAQAYYLNDGISGLGISQYCITPGFELQDNKNVEFSVAFAHYIVNDIYSEYASPIQNDFYTSLMFKKNWLRPGIAIDYSTGNFKEVLRQRNLYDSTSNDIKSFSFITSLSHEFNLGKSIGISNDFLFTPSFMLNFGNSNTTIQHKTNTINRASIFSRKKGKLAKFQNTKFQPESLGLALDLSYTIEKFTFAPQLYFDYTIPKIDLKQMATILNINISYTL